MLHLCDVSGGIKYRNIEVYDPAVNKFTIDQFGIPLFQQKKVEVLVKNTTYNLYTSDEGNYILLADEPGKFSFDEPVGVSSSFSNCLCISEKNTPKDTSHIDDYFMMDARFDPEQMLRILRYKEMIYSRFTQDKLKNCINKNYYPSVSDFSDDVIIENIDNVDNSAWSEKAVEKCMSNYPPVVKYEYGFVFRVRNDSLQLSTIRDHLKNVIGLIICPHSDIFRTIDEVSDFVKTA